MAGPLHGFCPLILTTLPRRKYYSYFRFTDRETEAQELIFLARGCMGNDGPVFECKWLESSPQALTCPASPPEMATVGVNEMGQGAR